MSSPFWTNSPNVLISQEYIAEIYPTPDMTYEHKLNAMTRMLIILTVIGCIITRSISFFYIGIICVLMIAWVYKTNRSEAGSVKDGFEMLDLEVDYDNSNSNYNPFNNKQSEFNKADSSVPINSSRPSGQRVSQTLDKSGFYTMLDDDFERGSKTNPFSNVLLTDIMDTPDRKQSPPSFNPAVDKNIRTDVKKAVQLVNPGIKNTSSQIFGDLWENFQLDTSLRNFYTTPNTKISNDQGSFGKFLYGNMPSSHDSTALGAMARVQNAFRYTLY